MKLQLNKLTAGMVLAGSVVALVGCGGGDAPTLKPAAAKVEKTIIATDQAAVTAAKTTVAALGTTGADFSIPADTPFDGSTTKIPAGSTLNLAPSASTETGAIADFSITVPGSTKTAEGTLLAGSCKFKVTGPSNTANILDGYTVGQTLTIGVCKLSIPTPSAVGSATAVVPAFTLGSQVIAADETITITVNDNGSITTLIPSTTPGGQPTEATLAPEGSVVLVSGGN